jgi:ubiquinone/menaquinone biosynthesis C-methylase UbiE
MTQSGEQPNWQWDETTTISTNYGDTAEAQNYDNRHSHSARNDAEYQAILDRIDPQSDWTLMDIGAGTGTFALAAAERCREVLAVDVSQAMLDIAASKAAAVGIENMKFLHGGFLTYQHASEPVDAITSHLALHHLPDMWKQIALGRVCGMLKSGGVFYLRDVVFQFPHARHGEVFDKWVDDAAERFGQACMASKAESHIKNEFSTFGRIMEGLLRRAGFQIEQADYSQRLVSYFCRKI